MLTMMMFNSILGGGKFNMELSMVCKDCAFKDKSCARSKKVTAECDLHVAGAALVKTASKLVFQVSYPGSEKRIVETYQA